MTWQPRYSDNSPRTASTYVRHDINGNVVTSIDTYVRHDITGAVVTPQPSTTTVTDPYGNTYSNWNGDYVKRDVNNQIVP